MPRYAVIDDGVVVGVLGASTPPTIDVPPNRKFVDITNIPDVKGGEIYTPDGVFKQPPTPLVPVSTTPSLETRMARVEGLLGIKV